MLAASKVKMGGAAVKKKMNKNTYDISSLKRVTKNFLESKSKCLFCKGQCSPSSAEITTKRNKKKCAARAKLYFVLIRPTAFFAIFVAVAAWLALHDFTFCFSKLQISTRASLLALDKSIYYIFTEITVSVLNASNGSFPTINIILNFKTDLNCLFHSLIHK